MTREARESRTDDCLQMCLRCSGAIATSVHSEADTRNDDHHARDHEIHVAVVEFVHPLHESRRVQSGQRRKKKHLKSDRRPQRGDPHALMVRPGQRTGDIAIVTTFLGDPHADEPRVRECQ